MSNFEIDNKKAAIRLRYKGITEENLELIPAEKVAVVTTTDAIKRVAIYARVSTTDADQTTSVELQQNFYRDMVINHKNWRLVGLYVDEGRTGTNIKHRHEFNRLIQDCKAGKIDIIITKSISRFARNIVDCISTIRMLKTLANPVGVYFEAERIFSLDDTIEMVLSLLSAIAQEESHIKSDLMNMSIEQRFSRGIFLLQPLLGYKKDETGKLVVFEDEADTIRICFYLYLLGHSLQEIADLLTAYGRKTKNGYPFWNSGGVSYILRNEKYCGDVLCRKTYTENYLTHHLKRNLQARNQYFQSDHHEPIVSKKVFETVAKISRCYKHTENYKRIIPKLYVINEGILKGFVSVHKNWPYTYKDYCEAALVGYNSVIQEVSNKLIGNDEYHGYSVVKGELFGSYDKFVLKITCFTLKFNYNCSVELGIAEKCEVFFNPITKQLAIRECALETSYTNVGSNNINGRPCLPEILGKNICGIIYGLMKWDTTKSYKIYGRLVSCNGAKVIIFDFEDAVMFDGSAASIGKNINLENVIAGSFGKSYLQFLTKEGFYAEPYIATAPVLVPESIIFSGVEMEMIKDICDKILRKWEYEDILERRYES